MIRGTQDISREVELYDTVMENTWDCLANA